MYEEKQAENLRGCILRETTKQKIQLKPKRLRRYDKRTRFYMNFQEGTNKFYTELGKEKITVNETPTIEDIKKF